MAEDRHGIVHDFPQGREDDKSQHHAYGMAVGFCGSVHAKPHKARKYGILGST